MTPNDEKEFYDLIRNLSKGIKKHGIAKVINALKQININTEGEISFTIIEFIEKSVCSKIGVPKDELFGFASRGEITIARKFCILLIRKHVPTLSDGEVGNHYNRTRQITHNTEKEYRKILEGKQVKFELDFLAIYNDLDKDVEKFILTLKLPKK